MKRTRRSLSKAFIIYFAIALQIFIPSAPVFVVYAEESAPPVETPCVAPEGTVRPTGSASVTYKWNCDSNLWENAYYTWNPNTRITTPKYTPEHTLNEATGMWEIREWVYLPPSGKYELRVTSTYAPAPPPSTSPAPSSPTTGSAIGNTGPNSDNIIDNANGTINTTGPGSSNTIQGNNNPTSVGNISTTGPGSTNGISLQPNSNQTTIDQNVAIDVTNNVDSSAVSGDASVLQNTTGGNATTGDATAMASIINMVQSTLGAQGIIPNLYTANIQGDYYGDIMINPGLLTASNSNCGCNGDLTVNASVDAAITNNVNLLARSGDAAVADNTRAGDASSGDAAAIANIVNMINSSIVAGQSFLGVLNIHGNFEGDVLLPEDVIDSLIAANVPTAQIECGCGDILANLNDTQNINNNITATAQSGHATVANNTHGGSASSGSADTSVTVFNVTGRNVIGQNALLVFVNVLGKWVGFITNAPAGATAAALGGGITENTLATGGDAEYNIDTNATINNNINVTAQTGNAEVRNNTYGGDATSGNAKASANVSNITNSNFGLSGWLGLLFINVLGNWFGSFGTNTAYGNLPPVPTSSGTTPTPAVMSTSGGSGAASGQRAAATTAGYKQPPPSVRVFQATVESDNDGKVVLASVSEASPPSSTSTLVVAPTRIPARDLLIGWSLVAVGCCTIAYFYRKRLGGVSYGQ